jgi:CheY-like chemotaxis protein
MDKKAKVLLVEDDMFLRDIYSETLAGGGFDVSTAADGNEALMKIKLGGWDMVLLDVVLPGLSGIQIMNEVRMLLVKPSKHILFLTNSDDNAELEKVLGYTDGYLLKSAYTPAQLIEKVKTFVY